VAHDSAMGVHYQTGGCHGRSAALAFCSQSEGLPYIICVLIIFFEIRVFDERSYAVEITQLSK